jgi:hypothetical protein
MMPTLPPKLKRLFKNFYHALLPNGRHCVKMGATTLALRLARQHHTLARWWAPRMCWGHLQTQ